MSPNHCWLLARQRLQLVPGEAADATSVVRQNGVAHPQRLPTTRRLAGSVGVPAGVRPEGALCDFAKMVFTDPS